eukprot:1059237-Rhodomonas_salina.2
MPVIRVRRRVRVCFKFKLLIELPGRGASAEGSRYLHCFTRPAAGPSTTVAQRCESPQTLWPLRAKRKLRIRKCSEGRGQ